MDRESGLPELADDAGIVVDDQRDRAVPLKLENALKLDQSSRSLVTLPLHQQFAGWQALFCEPTTSQLGQSYRAPGEPHDVVVDSQLVSEFGAVR